MENTKEIYKSYWSNYLRRKEKSLLSD